MTPRAMREAYDGPSLVIARGHRIAHGIDMRAGMDQRYRAVAGGYWPLMRCDPVLREAGKNPFLLDSPRLPLSDCTDRELRFRSPADGDPEEVERPHALARHAVEQRRRVYEEMATHGPERFPLPWKGSAAEAGFHAPIRTGFPRGSTSSRASSRVRPRVAAGSVVPVGASRWRRRG